MFGAHRVEFERQGRDVQRGKRLNMRIPIFLSSPTSLNKTQEHFRQLICDLLEQVALEPRALGRTDYPTRDPLREVCAIAKRCSGAVILGFSQFETATGVWKKGTPEQKENKGPLAFPTAWNQLEAGILFALELPILVFKQTGVSGGIFDNGVTDVFVHNIPESKVTALQKKDLQSVVLKWQAEVRNHYYGEYPSRRD
jgi:hypothetical protein